MTANNTSKYNKSNNNKNNKNNKNVKTVKTVKTNMLHIWLMFAVAGLVPLLVQLIECPSGLSAYDWFSTNDTEYDFFLKCKMIGIIIIACVMLAAGLWQFYKKRSIYVPYLKENLSIMICAGVYIVAAFISSVTAADVAGAFGGMYAQHEPFPVLAGYMIFLVFAYIFINSENAVKSFLQLFMWGVALISFLGVLQFLACDFFTTYMGKSIITMFSQIGAESISLSFEPGRVYMTLYNPNYVGSYVALVLPVIIAGIFIMDKIWQKTVMGLIAAMLLVCLIGSASTTGMTAVVLCLILTFVLCILLLKKFRKYIGIMFVLSALCLIVIGVVNRERINEAIDKYRLTDDVRILNSIEIGKEEIKIDYKDTILYASCNISDEGRMNLDIYDENHEKLSFGYDQTTDMIVSNDEFYKDICFSGAGIDDGSIGFNVICGSTYTFLYDKDSNEYCYYNVYGKKTTDIVKSKSIGFEGHEQFASNRGFIWSRSIPLLFDNILYGCGPDNFVYEFPNNDYVAMNNNTYSTQVVTRPHNMYLQIGVQTGVISLVAVIALYMIYLIKTVGLLLRTKNISGAYIMSMATLVGSFGYMICGLANDSTVCVAPVFWVLLGMGMACNRILKSR